MEEKQDEIKRYLADLREMKDLVNRYEERPIVEFWDFVSWGVLIVAGTLVHARFFLASMNMALLCVWLPVFIIGGFVETLAWFYTVKRFNTPLSLKRNQRFYFAIFCICIALCFTLYYIIHLDGPVPGVLLLLVSIMFALVAQVTYIALFFEVIITLITGLIISLLDLRSIPVSVLTGVFIGIMFIILGLHSRYLEKKHG